MSDFFFKVTDTLLKCSLVSVFILQGVGWPGYNKKIFNTFVGDL